MAAAAAAINSGLALTNRPTGTTNGGRRRANSAARSTLT
jgi:hypothetical protein